MQLAYVYTEHGEALEADFFIIYNVDINECSLRRMRNLFFRLPPQCHTNWEIADTPDEAKLWSIDTYMLANILDALQAIDWHFIAANSKHPPRPPKPFKRPDIKKKEVKPKPKGFWPGKTVVDRNAIVDKG